MKIQLIVLAVGAGLACLLAGAGTASAHARLKESVPKAGEVLQASPTEVRITFSNDIQKITGSFGIEVTDEAGTAVTAGAAAVQDDNRSVLFVALRPDLAPGRYVVKYKNVSDADGDPFEGGYAFYVGVQPTQEQLAQDALLEPPEGAATQTFVAGNPTAAVEDTPTPAVSIATRPSGNVPPSGSSPDSNDGDGNRMTTIAFVAAAVAAVAVIGGGIFLTMRRKQG